MLTEVGMRFGSMEARQKSRPMMLLRLPLLIPRFDVDDDARRYYYLPAAADGVPP